jgi:hypothetical protein
MQSVRAAEKEAQKLRRESDMENKLREWREKQMCGRSRKETEATDKVE